MAEQKDVNAPVASDLPDFCFVHGGDTAQSGQYVRAVRRGEQGYSPTTYDERDPDKAAQLVKFLNTRLGVSELQAECMLNGSMFGWDTPSASPAFVSARMTLPAVNPAKDLPFIVGQTGKVTIYAANGDPLPGNWTGICVAGNDVKKFWYIGRDNGERSFDVLQAKDYETAVQEVAAKKLGFSVADADRMLGMADQFLEDWETNEGQGNPECEERRVEYDAIRPQLVMAPDMYRLCQQTAAIKGMVSIEDGVMTLENGESLDFRSICAAVLAQPAKTSSVDVALPEGVEVVTAGRHVGTVSEVTGQYAMQSAGRGKIVAHELARFDVAPKAGDALDVQYKGGKAVVAEPVQALARE